MPAAGTQTGTFTAMGLTEQEAAILRLVAGGYSNKEVADTSAFRWAR